jgi:hypothetical protein
VLFEGEMSAKKQLTNLVGKSHFISDKATDKLNEICMEKGLSREQVTKETDQSDLMEGLYIKVEEDGVVKERYKYVRASFFTSVMNSESHWLERPIIPNVLESNVDIFKV